jgi:hypothetical protein
MLTTLMTEREIVDAAVPIVRQVLADCKWHTLEEVDPLMPDSLVEAYANLMPELGIHSELEYKLARARMDLTGMAWWRLLETENGYEPARSRRDKRVRRRPPLKGKRAAVAAARKADILRGYPLLLTTFIDGESPSADPKGFLARAGIDAAVHLSILGRLVRDLETESDKTRRRRIKRFFVALEEEAIDPVCCELFVNINPGTTSYQVQILKLLQRLVRYVDRDTCEPLARCLYKFTYSSSREAEARFKAHDVWKLVRAKANTFDTPN